MLKKPTYFPNLLMIGGSKRHVGKTTLVCQIIKQFSKEYPIIALKASSIRQDETIKHGLHENSPDSKWEIVEENNRSGLKDTSKMLLAGAEKVFYIRAEDKYLASAFLLWHKTLDSSFFIVAESIGLRFIIEPAIFLLLKFDYPHEIKNSFYQLEKYADRVLLSDGQKIISPLPAIGIKEQQWIIQ